MRDRSKGERLSASWLLLSANGKGEGDRYAQEAGNGQGVWECRHPVRRINRSCGREHLPDATVNCISEKYMSSPNYWQCVHKLTFPNVFLLLAFIKYFASNSKKMAIEKLELKRNIKLTPDISGALNIIGNL